MKLFTLTCLYLSSFAAGQEEADVGVKQQRETDCSLECNGIRVELQRVEKALDESRTSQKAVSLEFDKFKTSHQEEIDAWKSKLETSNEQATHLAAESSKLRSDLSEATARIDDEVKLLEKTQAELKAVKDREIAFQKETEANLAKLHQEIEDLMNHKLKASELETHISFLQKDLEAHREELTSTKSVLNEELEVNKRELMEIRRRSLRDQELLKVMHEQASSTHVNMTLIYQDASIGAKKALAVVGECHNQFMEWFHPMLQLLMAVYSNHLDPPIQSSMSFLQDQYDAHLRETMDGTIRPALAPVSGPASDVSAKVHTYISSSLREALTTFSTYLILLSEGDSVHGMEDDDEQSLNQWRIWLALKLQYIAEHAEVFVTRTAYVIIAYLLFRLLFPAKRANAPPKRTAKQVKEKRNRNRKGKNQEGRKIKSQ